MTKYQEHFMYTTSFIKKFLKVKMATLLLGHPVYGVKFKKSKNDPSLHVDFNV